MSTDIAPSLGAGAPFTQLGRGTTPGYDAIDVRRVATVAFQEGAIDATAYKVAQRGAGANMSVDIAASAGSAVVQGDAVTGQGRYVIPPHTVTINEAITTADATNPRLDQAVLEVLDDTHDASGLNKARVRIIAGTPTGGATLANRSGAAALPNGAVRLADILVAISDTSITTAEIRDRRPWAKGAYYRYERLASGDYTIASATMTVIDATNMEPRMECSGVPMRARLVGDTFNSGANNTNSFEIRQDTAALATSNRRLRDYQDSVSDIAGSGLLLDVEFSPAAGSHLIGPYWAASAGTGTLKGDATFSAAFVLEEIVRTSASNT